ncbi:hypothetical protein ACP4OV_016298 [Aristida adscensionis]
MAELLVSAATGALSSVLAKLAAVLGDEYKHFKGVRGEIKFLTQELAAMHAFLLRMSEEENPGVQDMFMLGVDDESTKPDGFIDRCKKLLSRTKKRRRIAKAIQDLKAQVKEIGERNAGYRIGGTAMKTGDVAIDPRALSIFEDASKLVAIDEPKHEVISFLAGEDVCVSSSHQPRIVSIVGCGGVGKTTLANQVYEELKQQFECRAFLSVSRNPDMNRILRTILSQVTRQRYCETESVSIQQLIMEINEFLQTKRYFIVVDDVWDVKTWDIIKRALSNNSCGSMIITTTRRYDVAKACCSLYCGLVYESKLLEEQDSKRLFLNRIFGRGEECPEALNDISDKILKKCGGLPLAIIAISGLLANKARNGVHSVAEWDQVETSIGHGLERDTSVEEMMGILSLSYFDLPYHLKACLLYLSIFPEDHEIEKQRLVRRWVSEGFIPTESTCTLYESGEKCFNELINRNLIFPRGIYEFTGQKFLRVLDMGYRHSIENHHLANIGELLQLRYLSLGSKLITELPEQIGELRHLETLDLRGCYSLTKLPTTIVQLKRLVSLLMSLTVKLRMPVGITNLQSLEELNFINVDIKEAATCFEEIGELSRIRNLGMTWCLDPCPLDKGSQMEYLKKRALQKMVSSVQRLNKIQVPRWMKSLVNIEELDLLLKEFEQEGLYILGGLPVLVILRLNVVTKAGEERPSSADGRRLVVSRSCGYRSLRCLKIENWFRDSSVVSNPMLIFEAGSMPELEELSIDFNADVTVSGINNGRLDFGLKHPAQLTRAECCIFGSRLNVMLLKTFVKKALQNHPKDPDFGINCMITDASGSGYPSVAQEVAADHAVATDASGGEMIGCSSTAALLLPQGISFTLDLDHDHHGATTTTLGPRRGRRRRQQRRRSTPGQRKPQRPPPAVATVSGGHGSLVVPDEGAAPISNGLGPGFIAALQYQTLAPCFVFNAKQQAPDCHEPSRHDVPDAQSPAPTSWDLSDLISAFDPLSL